ncbi:phosphopantetheine binding protein [Paenibacillus cellulosilyticus]|uniref:Phosphopantetheine binding protein n=1 Tax=Paenibacillus cellulosilyticus TaxID=375489 RepID=A0A2V2YXZ3_9BACL|nr:phosphopantetheine binding protein [Paenibacillus cellulosilyticus]QKS43693.1 alanine-phosphoribitol ligase [Paenibacillus cellulosilyticus]
MMISIEEIISIIKRLNNIGEILEDTLFAELELDSTHIVELLVEIEIMLNIDVLDDQLNLDELLTIRDVHEYILRFASNDSVR